MPRLRSFRDSLISRLLTGKRTAPNRVPFVTIVPFGGIACAGPKIDKGDTMAPAKLSISSASTAFDSRPASG